MTTYKTVLLGENHPGYDAAQPKYVAAGFLVTPDSFFTTELFEIAEGTPESLSAIPFVQQSLAEQLDAVFSQQSIDLQAQFSPLRAAIKLELDQGRFAIAKRVIELAQIPPELEAQRQALLALFPEA